MTFVPSMLKWFDAAFGQWPWKLLPMAVVVVISVAAMAQLGLLWNSLRRDKEYRGPIDTTYASVNEALAQLRVTLRRLATVGAPDAIGIVEHVIASAASIGASDIHLSPLARGLSITLRVYGTIHSVDTLPRETSALVCNRLKVLARLDLHQRAVPQDGRLVIELAGRMIEARISTLPTEGGERIVLRLVEGARSIPGFVSLGFSDEVASGLAQLLTRPQGLLFVTGPVGSGKSTTLYAILSHIYQTRGDNTTIVTLEDPIELRLPFAAQTQINARTKMTFANGLRSALRQDPNVLMVGEIRDRETADIAMQASLTGHLLLTTVHADDATGPFARMIDMGIEPFLLASSVAGCLSQRLVRRLCPKCRRPATADAASLAKYRAAGFDITVDGYFDAVGCDACEQQGFVGRIPLAELLTLDTHVRAELHDGCPAEIMRQRAIARGMTPLLADGIRLAKVGDTTLAEVLRVVG